MIESIEIIYDAQSLVGTCYLEIKPGKYTGEHWNEESIFFTDETFTYLSLAIKKHYKRYSLWGMSEIDKPTWTRIVAELEDLKLFLQNNPNANDFKNHIGFLYIETTEDYFKEKLNLHVVDLIKVITEFQDWINENSKDNEYVSILGI